jgi:hypothetical protein
LERLCLFEFFAQVDSGARAEAWRKPVDVERFLDPLKLQQETLLQLVREPFNEQGSATSAWSPLTGFSEQ